MKPWLATVTAIAVVAIVAVVFLIVDRSQMSHSTAKPRPVTRAANDLSDSVMKPTTGLPVGIRQGSSTNFSIPQTDQGFALSSPAPLYLDGRSGDQSLQPGIYQTYPYSMILAVPRKGIDDGILRKSPDDSSRMPVVKPHVEVVPRL